ncbi:MAG TPA: serine/threonine-protein kinase [Sedimentisphaerales bacterium]|nr:serine/threonine-protein kinase [Sedimentisphaerales bacterium]
MTKDILKVGGFTIIKRIGTGARSAIYLATNEQDNTPVALKRVSFEKAEDTRIFEQVETEYRVARRIDHPYVRKCYELRRIRSMFRVKELLLSMEFFDGQSLEEGPTLSLVDVLLVFRMVANGLNAMHQQGFVHCDIKPNNILLNKSGAIKIIDLGQSCRIGTTKPRIQGTPDYIAPEQVRRKPLGSRTDVFNLGATMYWALTGKNVPTLIPKKKNGLGLVIPKNCPAPHEIRDKVPTGVSRLVMDCIKDNPAERPRDMMTVISRLDLMIHSILGDKIRTNKNAPNNN